MTHVPIASVADPALRERASRFTTFWCERAWLGGQTAVADVLIEVQDGSIVSVRAGVATAPSSAQHLSGLVLPGFANAHPHAFQRALRGRTHQSEGSFWTWRRQMYELAGALAT